MGNPAGNDGPVTDFFRMWEDGIGIAFVFLNESGVGPLGEVAFQNGVRVPITQITDAEGNDVDSWDEAVDFHFGSPATGYGSSPVCYLMFDKSTVH